MRKYPPLFVGGTAKSQAKGRDVPVLIHRGQEELQTVIHSTIPGRGQLGVESHRGLMTC